MPGEAKSPVAEVPLTRLQAQLKLGLFAPHDYVMVVGIVLVWVVIGFYWAFKPEPNFITVLFGLLLSLTFFMAWVVALVYRVIVLALDIQADINLLPEAAARIAVGYFQGKAPPPGRK